MWMTYALERWNFKKGNFPIEQIRELQGVTAECLSLDTCLRFDWRRLLQQSEEQRYGRIWFTYCKMSPTIRILERTLVKESCRFSLVLFECSFLNKLILRTDLAEMLVWMTLQQPLKSVLWSMSHVCTRKACCVVWPEFIRDAPYRYGLVSIWSTILPINWKLLLDKSFSKENALRRDLLGHGLIAL